MRRALAWVGIACALIGLPARAQQDAGRTGSVTIGASGDLLAHIRVVRAARAQPSGFDHVLGSL